MGSKSCMEIKSMAIRKGTLAELLACEHEAIRSCSTITKTVKSLYRALARRETETIARLVAADVEWWFHGPPHCQHMMRTLTGESKSVDFKFKPRSITTIADRVIVEGWKGSKAYWVHVWSVKEGVITQLREYFDTWLTVIFRVPDDGIEGGIFRAWQSERFNRSLPDVVLAI